MLTEVSPTRERTPPWRPRVRHFSAANHPSYDPTDQSPREQPDEAAFLAILLAATLHPPIAHEHAGDPPEDGEQHRHHRCAILNRQDLTEARVRRCRRHQSSRQGR